MTTKNRRQLVLSSLICAFSSNSFAAEVPINVGVGPSIFIIPDTVARTKIEPFYGLNLKIKAIIDKATIEKNKDKIPAKFRSAVSKTNEVRIGYLYIPANIILTTGDDAEKPSLFGATWKPISIDLPVKLGSTSLSIGTELILTYALITVGSRVQDGETTSFTRSTTHFIRPGLGLSAELEQPLTDQFVLSAGVTSSYYIPQRLKGADDTRDSLWRMGEARVTLNYRFPIEIPL
jgi:hypothetical protein